LEQQCKESRGKNKDVQQEEVQKEDVQEEYIWKEQKCHNKYKQERNTVQVLKTPLNSRTKVSRCSQSEMPN